MTERTDQRRDHSHILGPRASSQDNVCNILSRASALVNRSTGYKHVRTRKLSIESQHTNKSKGTRRPSPSIPIPHLEVNSTSTESEEVDDELVAQADWNDYNMALRIVSGMDKRRHDALKCQENSCDDTFDLTQRIINNIVRKRNGVIDSDTHIDEIKFQATGASRISRPHSNASLSEHELVFVMDID